MNMVFDQSQRERVITVLLDKFREYLDPHIIFPGIQVYNDYYPISPCTIMMAAGSPVTVSLVVPYKPIYPDPSVVERAITGHDLSLRYIGTSSGVQEVDIMLDLEVIQSDAIIRRHYILRRGVYLLQQDHDTFDDLLEKVAREHGIRRTQRQQ